MVLLYNKLPRCYNDTNQARWVIYLEWRDKTYLCDSCVGDFLVVYSQYPLLGKGMVGIDRVISLQHN